MFLLSHHPPDELDRTYAVGPVRLCARCLGTYPALGMALVSQLKHHAPLAWRHDFTWVLLLTLPALLDWAAGRLSPSQGHNLVRTGTGVGLGLALGRALYIHLQRPLPGVLLAQAALVTGVAAPVMLFRMVRRRR